MEEKRKSDCGIEYVEVTKEDGTKGYKLNNGVVLDHIPTLADTGTNNLKTYFNLTEEEKKQRIDNMVSKSVKARQERKTFKESLESFLSIKANRNLIKESLPNEVIALLPKDTDITLQDLITLKAIEMSVSGSEKHSVFVRDTVGEKPTDKTEVQAEIITDADRALIDKLCKRVGSE